MGTLRTGVPSTSKRIRFECRSCGKDSTTERTGHEERGYSECFDCQAHHSMSTLSRRIFWPESKQTAQALKALVFGAITLFTLTISPSPVRAEISSSQAVRAIVGEAAGETFEGMVAVGEAIRNRGSLYGVYGLKRDISKEPAWVFVKALDAWIVSEVTNLTHGATHWENVEEFGMPSWASEMTETARVGSHTFFKEPSTHKQKGE